MDDYLLTRAEYVGIFPTHCHTCGITPDHRNGKMRNWEISQGLSIDASFVLSSYTPTYRNALCSTHN